MRLVIFENAYFLQSLGWAIVNSLWQSALLLFLYKLIRLADKKSASFRYNLGLVCLFFSFAWFIVTLMQGYVFFKNESSVSNILINSEYTQQLNKIVSYFSILYLGSLFFYSIRFTKNYINTNALKKNGLVKVPVELRIFISQTALNLGIKNKVQVWLSEHVNVPSVIGFIKPVVLLPIGFCSHLTTEQAEAILLHELAHIKRNDYLINILQSIIELVLFFNPFVRVLNDSIKKERENCCDDYVMNYQYDQYNYANALLILEEQRTNQLAFTMASSNGQMNLLNRIKRLKNLEHNSYSKPLEKLYMIGLSIILIMSMIVFSPMIEHQKNNKILSQNKTQKSFEIQRSRVNENKIIIKPSIATIPIVANNQISKLFNSPTVKIKRNKAGIINKPGEDYPVAFINKDILQTNSFNKIIATSNEEDDSVGEYFIKITEEQSGKKDINIYYFELNNNKGNTNLKPLIFLYKPIRKNVKPKVIKADSIEKRITS